MIRITSFFPFQKLQRMTQEFYEDKALVSIKSLSFEREFEFEYKNVDEIADAFGISSSQISFAFWMLFLIAMSFLVFRKYIYAHSFLLYAAQIFYVASILLFIFGCKKSWHFRITDTNDNAITYIKQTRQNRELIPQVIEMIKAKSNYVEEISVTHPFMDEPVSFEYVTYDISDLGKSTDRFYKDKIIGIQKSIFGESSYHIKYSHLNGKVFRGKSSIDVGWVPFIFIFLLLVISGFYFGFAGSLGIHMPLVFAYIIFALLALFLLSALFGLMKREEIGLYNKNGRVIYWTSVNRKNKEKIEKIIEFVQSSIPTEENVQLVKETQ